MPDRLAEIVNVRDFGAVGGGNTDDTAAVQAAFNAAFAPASSPNGQGNSYLNRPVFFPAGRYKITSPLLLTDVWGGHIFGAGMNQSQLIWAGSYNGNTVPNADNTITPLLMTNGFAYSRLEGLGFNMSDSSGAHNSACIYFFGNYSSSPNQFSDLSCSNANTGIMVGWDSPNNVSECIYTNVQLWYCTNYGIRVVGQNTLNHWIIGGGANNCGTAARAPYTPWAAGGKIMQPIR